MVMSYQSEPMEPVAEPYPVTESFMSRSFLTVRPDMEIYDVMDLLVRHNTTGAPVVDNIGKLVGIISERDCLKVVNRVLYNHNSAALGGPVRDYMTTTVQTVSPKACLYEVADLFLQLPYKKLPVELNGRVVGMVKRHTVLSVLQEYHRSRMRYLRTATSVRKR